MSSDQQTPRTALITGASTGIGAAYARQLASRGHSLVLVARREQALSELATEIRERFGVTATPLVADLTQAQDLARVERRLAVGNPDDPAASGEYPETAPIDLLVNNAGMGAGGAVASQPVAELDRLLELNVRALVRLTRAVLPAQLARRSAGITIPLGVVNVSSMAAALPAVPGNAAYGASKAFVRSFSESVAAEVRPQGITVTVVLPGYVRTEMTREMQEQGAPEIAWVDKDRVVVDSLRAWATGRSSVTPGAQYKLAGGVLRLVPSSVAQAVFGRRRE
ncbi:SDR family NAD(P)-dependent oxidoreductase [Lipingzhangella sp. LS1_29]|uniref:SDR family NAD(P)-dependent oxidoreductase n=1 Tax=Lipingzhangella rawalii TaxID=2055835 RepID=A0ABU2H426_9ACTN|nr:SDR family NAD(P)-dependent oxidoreductase [Lipingzhangella rawalii]MDS1270048.1 SDR family NAD(P)-dependent oxidoreductase [Lipingzhangella rawalii]